MNGNSTPSRCAASDKRRLEQVINPIGALALERVLGFQPFSGFPRIDVVRALNRVDGHGRRYSPLRGSGRSGFSGEVEGRHPLERSSSCEIVDGRCVRGNTSRPARRAGRSNQHPYCPPEVFVISDKQVNVVA